MTTSRTPIATLPYDNNDNDKINNEQIIEEGRSRNHSLIVIIILLEIQSKVQVLVYVLIICMVLVLLLVFVQALELLRCMYCLFLCCLCRCWY